MNIYREIIIDTIKEMLKDGIKDLPFNYEKTGVVEEVLLTGEYKVKIDGSVSTMKAIHDIVYAVGDVVSVIVFNGNYSNKKILCKK